MFPVMLLMPVGVAITFSGISYTAELFKAKAFSKLAPLSLAIYLTHDGIANRLVNYYFSGLSYKLSVALSAGFMIVFILIYFLLIKLMKLCAAKIKKFFNESPVQQN